MLTKIFEPLKHHRIWQTLRHCAFCGSSYSPKLWLCSHCLNQLKKNFLEPQNMLRLQSHFRHVRLIDWTQENDQFIRFIIQSLKGHFQSPLFNLLSQEFHLRLSQLSSITRDAPFCIIPCPSRTKHADHATFLSKNLSDCMHFPLIKALKHPDFEKTQKNKNILFRKEKKFKQVCSNKAFPKKHLLVFVDDIVTTGSTAKAAHKALGQPEPFMIWSLFWRKYL